MIICGKLIPEAWMVCGICALDIKDGIEYYPEPPEEEEKEKP